MELDNFFAKRDKKKIKGQKFYSTEEMAKRLEDNERKEEKAVQQAVTEAHIQIKKETPKEDRPETPEELVISPEEQWKDFEDKPQVDTTDLKVANLNLSDEENDGSDANDDDDGANGDGKKESVWSIEPKQQPTVCDAVDLAMEDGKDVKATVAAVRASEAKYVPPRSSEMTAAPLPKGGRRKKNAPDFKNEETFPTLGMKPKKTTKVKKDGHGTPNQSNSSKPFGNSSNDPSVYQPPQLRMKTKNRFGGLTDHGDKF